MLAKYESAPTGESRGAYRGAVRTVPMDLKLAMHVTAGDTYEWSQVLLARASFGGRLEFLTAAWERVLGYGRHELEGKTLRQLMGADDDAAAEVIGAILEERTMDPVDVTLRSRAGEAKVLRLHRQLDEYGGRIMIVAEEDPLPLVVRAGAHTGRRSSYETP
jgi:PAS domain S-box-containing protein